MDGGIFETVGGVGGFVRRGGMWVRLALAGDQGQADGIVGAERARGRGGRWKAPIGHPEVIRLGRVGVRDFSCERDSVLSRNRAVSRPRSWRQFRLSDRTSGIPMRFGNRFGGRSLSGIGSRRQRYFDHLRKLGIEFESDLFRYFGHDVFHDSPLGSLKVGLSKTEVSLTLRNVHAVNQINAIIRSKVDPRDCATRILFGGVRRCLVALDPRHEVRYFYHSSEIDLRDGAFEMSLFLENGRYRGRVQLVCSTVSIEDISRKLGKYELGTANVLWPESSPGGAGGDGCL